jgi:hypothetical protein
MLLLMLQFVVAGMLEEEVQSGAATQADQHRQRVLQQLPNTSNQQQALPRTAVAVLSGNAVGSSSGSLLTSPRQQQQQQQQVQHKQQLLWPGLHRSLLHAGQSVAAGSSASSGKTGPSSKQQLLSVGGSDTGEGGEWSAQSGWFAG